MYPMPEFQERDPEAVREFIRKYPLAMVVANGENGPVATHVPLLLKSANPLTLRGHLMRKTPYWHGFKEAREVLVAFTGPNAPVLESWNTSLPFGGTWNYMAVHARGRLTFLPESDLVEILRDLKNLHEDDPTRTFENLTPDYVPSLIKAIEGFEIVISDVQAVFKLSQNRTREDFESTVKHLRDRGGEHALVADEMVARRGQFFPESP